ncbi:hypothetical protein ACUODF_56930, partial [Escherichia coli]
ASAPHGRRRSSASAFLNKAYERIQKEFGTNVMHGLKGAPALLISGQPIVKYEANRIQRKKLFGIF